MIRRVLGADVRGAAAMEFGIVAPVFLMLLMGLLDLGQRTYIAGILNGAVQDAARSSALESANTDRADERVRAAVSAVAPGGRVESTRVSYFDFNDIGRAERYGDTNNNNICDNGEVYTDENRNKRWDAKLGNSGSNGGANDVILYTVRLRYNGLFASALLPGSLGERSVVAKAIRKNQPYGTQQARGAEALSC